MTSRLLELMRGATEEDWQFWRLLPSLRDRTLVYDGVSRSVEPAEGYDVPWPVLWSLCRYSRKHIFHGRFLPRAHRYREAMISWESKQRWAWFFRGCDRERLALNDRGAPLPEDAKFFFTAARPAPFRGVTDPALEAWLGRCRRAFMGAVNRSLAHGRFFSEVGRICWA